MNPYIPFTVALIGTVALLTMKAGGEVASKVGVSISVFPIAQGEWGYSIVSGTDFIHTERGFADEKTARDTANAYVAANINPKPPV